MKKLIALAFSLVAALAQASGGPTALKQSGADLSDRASLQRGAALYSNYCLGCHSLKYMRYSRVAADLGLTEAQVMGSLNFTGAKFGDQMTIAMQPADADKWIGKAAPDLLNSTCTSKSALSQPRRWAAVTASRCSAGGAERESIWTIASG